MVLLTNSLEGVTPSGTTLTQGAGGNTGGASGSFFDSVTLGTGVTLASDSAHAAHGTLSCKIASGATSASSWVQWDTSAGSLTTVWVRIYLFFTANPSVTLKLFQLLNVSTQCGDFQINTAGKIDHVAGTGSTATNTGSVAIALNQWVRLECKFVASATVGQLEHKLFNTADSTTPDETLTDAANQNTNTVITKNRIGLTVAQSNFGPFWLDDFGLSDSGYLGPAVSAPSYVPGTRPPPRRLPPSRRSHVAVAPAQLDAPFPFGDVTQRRETWPRGLPRHGRATFAVPPQLNPPYPFTEIAQRRQAQPRALLRRGRQVGVTPPQVNPPYLFTELRQWRQPRGFWPRRGRQAQPVPGQQAAPSASAFVAQPLRHARLMTALRRRPAAAVVPGQPHPPLVPRRQRPGLPPGRRGKVTAAHLGQHEPPRQRTRPRLGPLIRRRAARLLPWPQATAPVLQNAASAPAVTARDASAASVAAMASVPAVTPAGGSAAAVAAQAAGSAAAQKASSTPGVSDG